jgi:SAM-dependent methyltransferase
MKKSISKILFYCNLIGFDLFKFTNFFRSLSYYYKTYKVITKQNEINGRVVQFGKFFPILHERFELGGTSNGHYFNQDLFVARKIFDSNPIEHIDIGSRIDGFVAHVASFRKIIVYDIRPFVSNIYNMSFIQADLMKLPSHLYNSCESISSLHALEHFGLGRYGDSIDINGHVKGINNIYDMLRTGGKFYFSGPIGPERIEFNAHRVYSIHSLVNLFNNKFKIVSFSYVDDLGDFYEDVELTEKSIDYNFNCIYGCGIFELVKI